MGMGMGRVLAVTFQRFVVCRVESLIKTHFHNSSLGSCEGVSLRACSSVDTTY
jgi:hypothetical protein